MKPRRVLLSAYACAPNRGSEPGIGWRWLKAAAENNDVVVLVMHSAFDEVAREVARQGLDSVTVVGHGIPVGEESIASFPLGRYIHYLAWQLTAIRKGRSLHKCYQFDLGHHVTYGSIRFPTFLAYMEIPYLLGPIGGAETMPHEFWLDMGYKDRVFSIGRSISTKLAKYDPFVRRSLSRSGAILVATPEANSWLPGVHRGKSIQMQAVGFEERPPDARPSKTSSPLRLLFVGRLVYWKGVQYALRAMQVALDRGVDALLTIVGDGPSLERLRRLTIRLGIEERVSFAGWRARQELELVYAEHDVLIMPSFQDTGGYVVIEAISRGLPVICLDQGGPAVLVTPDKGTRIPVETPAQVIEGIAQSISAFASGTASERPVCPKLRPIDDKVTTAVELADELEHLYSMILRSATRRGGTVS